MKDLLEILFTGSLMTTVFLRGSGIFLLSVAFYLLMTALIGPDPLALVGVFVFVIVGIIAIMLSTTFGLLWLMLRKKIKCT